MRLVMSYTRVSRALKSILSLTCLLAFSFAAPAADKPAERTTEKPRRSPVRAGLLQEDFPSQGACISANFPAKNTALKGLAIRVGNGANMLFDTDLLRMAAGWTGGYISTHGVAFDGGHGAHPQIIWE